MQLTLCRHHPQISNRRIEKHERQTLESQLVLWWLIHTVACCAEMSTGYNLQSITDVDDKSAGLIRHVVPLFILAPDLKARDGN